MKTIAIYYPYFAGGGAEAVALWMLQALKDDYDLTLFTIGDVNFEKLNSMYETNLSRNCVKIQSILPFFLRDICLFMIANNKDIRFLFLHLLLKYFKEKCHDYDLVISAYNAADLGKIGIQYIHWIKVIEGLPFYKKVSNFSDIELRKNISLANSHFVAKVAKETYGVDAEVVFPPVVMEPPNISWSAKEDAFICSGRIVKSKSPEIVINILKLVREQGFDIKLYLTGGGGGVYEWQYNRFLKKIIKENESWITLYENLPYKEYMKILAKCKYGIHFKKEPFGISIAEMVKAGIIPFVRGAGGQVEIVGEHNEELFFNTEEEAVKKIIAILNNSALQNKICQSLENQKKLFSTQKFMSQINEVVSNYFNSSEQISNTLATITKGKKDVE